MIIFLGVSRSSLIGQKLCLMSKDQAQKLKSISYIENALKDYFLEEIYFLIRLYVKKWVVRRIRMMMNFSLFFMMVVT